MILAAGSSLAQRPVIYCMQVGKMGDIASVFALTAGWAPLQALLALASAPLGARGGGPMSDEPMKVALFSLGNMCTHASCSQVLLSLGLPATLHRLSASPDAVVKKYCARIQVSFSDSFQQATALLLRSA